MSNLWKGRIVGIAVVAILIIAPLGSYLYLRKGLEYRLKAIDELEPKEIPSKIAKRVNDVRRVSAAMLLHIDRDKVDTRTVTQKLCNRINDRKLFDIVSTADSSVFELSALKHSIELISDTIIEQNTDYDFILVDSSGVVRNTYTSPEISQATLIKHLSVVIPLPKKREITLERDYSD